MVSKSNGKEKKPSEDKLPEAKPVNGEPKTDPSSEAEADGVIKEETNGIETKKDDRRQEFLKQRHASIHQIASAPAAIKTGSSSPKGSSSEQDEQLRVRKQLQSIYLDTIVPLEESYHLYHEAFGLSGPFTAAEFLAPPMVLVVGAYSTGKTTFLSHLLGDRKFPGIHIGPEPTTDAFTALVYGTDGDTIVPGPTATVTPQWPFAGSTRLGASFLANFRASVCDSPLLQHITLIDTPGIVSTSDVRPYDFDAACRWFAARADSILFLLDAHKLQVEPLQQLRSLLQHNSDKLCCVLNKSDALPPEDLLRVYGSTLWHLARATQGQEVTRVYCGSFWSEPLRHTAWESLLERDEGALLDELLMLPRVAVQRKVNTVVERLRWVRVHVCVLGTIAAQVRSTFSPKAKQQTIRANLDQICKEVAQKYGLAAGDMPTVETLGAALDAFDDWTVFPSVDRAVLQKLDRLLENDIPALLRAANAASEGSVRGYTTRGRGGISMATRKTRRSSGNWFTSFVMMVVAIVTGLVVGPVHDLFAPVQTGYATLDDMIDQAATMYGDVVIGDTTKRVGAATHTDQSTTTMDGAEL